MSASKALSRDQALDDYFDALLAEVEDPVSEAIPLIEEELSVEESLNPILEVVSGDELPDVEISLDDLSDENAVEPVFIEDEPVLSESGESEEPIPGSDLELSETEGVTPRESADLSVETGTDLPGEQEAKAKEDPDSSSVTDAAVPLHVVDDEGEIQGWDFDDESGSYSAYYDEEPEPQLQIMPKEEEPVRVPLYKSEADLSHIEALLAQLKSQDVVEEEATSVTVDPETDVSAETVSQVTADTDAEADTIEAAELLAEPEVAAEPVSESVVDDATETSPETQAAGDHQPPEDWSNIDYGERFQVLFFESWGVTYAVPLAELGGIHKLEELNHLIGRPDWYMGLQSNRETKFDVVDTAKWVMNDKISDDNHRESYSYIVVLGNSRWSLACDTLIGTETVESAQVRWRETAGKRPWLAGMVKEKMCALIHVEALVALLDKGIDAKQLA